MYFFPAFVCEVGTSTSVYLYYLIKNLLFRFKYYFIKILFLLSISFIVLFTLSPSENVIYFYYLYSLLLLILYTLQPRWTHAKLQITKQIIIPYRPFYKLIIDTHMSSLHLSFLLVIISLIFLLFLSFLLFFVINYY